MYWNLDLARKKKKKKGQEYVSPQDETIHAYFPGYSYALVKKIA